MSNKFEHGDIVYWCHIVQGKADICFGVVDEVYYGAIGVDILVPKDCRTVENIPIKEWTPNGRIYKLPKNWNYHTKLFEYGYTHNWDKNDNDFLKNKLQKIKCSDKEKILEAYNNGWLVKSCDNNHSIADVFIDKGTWRLEKKFRTVGYHYLYKNIDNISISPHKVYKTYEEAFAEKQSYEAEFKRIQNLSDIDWSIEQIDETLNRWAAIYSISEYQKRAHRDFLMNLPNIENIEVRIGLGNIQWKYWKNKKWNNIEI